MMLNTTTTTTTADLCRLLDGVAEQLADLPGRVPEDARIAKLLLLVVSAGLYGSPNQPILDLLARKYGCDVAEARAVAEAVAALTLRLGAWLGRDER